MKTYVVAFVHFDGELSQSVQRAHTPEDAVRQWELQYYDDAYRAEYGLYFSNFATLEEMCDNARQTDHDMSVIEVA